MPTNADRLDNRYLPSVRAAAKVQSPYAADETYRLAIDHGATIGRQTHLSSVSGHTDRHIPQQRVVDADTLQLHLDYLGGVPAIRLSDDPTVCIDVADDDREVPVVDGVGQFAAGDC